MGKYNKNINKNNKKIFDHLNRMRSRSLDDVPDVDVLNNNNANKNKSKNGSNQDNNNLRRNGVTYRNGVTSRNGNTTRNGNGTHYSVKKGVMVTNL